MIPLHCSISTSLRIRLTYGKGNGTFSLPCQLSIRRCPRQREQNTKQYKLLSCLSTTTLQAILSMGLTETQLEDSKEIIKTLRNRCNAGRNYHVWRHWFASSTQRENQLCELRDLARKSEFETDCCARCTPTRILGQIVFGVHSNEVQVDLLKKGITLTLDEALATVRTAEASGHQAANIRQGETAKIQRVESTYKKTHFLPQWERRSSTERAERTSKRRLLRVRVIKTMRKRRLPGKRQGVQEMW